jgi:hypothetical protein
VEKVNILETDFERLYELWEWARRESAAANNLMLAEDQGQGRAIAFHLFRGWHALASMFACKAGVAEPELDSFTLGSESKILAPLSSRRLEEWAPSFETVRDAALRVPWHSGAPEPDERHLRGQARALGRCIRAHRPRVERATIGRTAWRTGRRKVAIALSVLVLVVVAVDIGRRLWVHFTAPGDAQDTVAVIPQEVHLSLEQLSDEKPQGYAWDEAGTVRFMDRVVVSLGGIAHPGTLNLSLDGNDRYVLSLMAGDERVGFVEVEPSWNGGLEVYTVAVPEEAGSLGFDSVVIEADAGDGAYALGHLLLGPIEDEQPTAVEGPG